jgi:hypothetical protein
MTFAVAVALAATISLASKPAFADDKPQLCTLDNGKTWYFAIGRTVFEMIDPDFSHGGPGVSGMDPSLALIPPNPASPIGCKDNPQQLGNYSALNWPRLEPESYTGPIPKVTEAFGIGRYPYRAELPPNIDPVIIQMETVARVCEHTKFITRYDDGTILCADTKGQLNWALVDQKSPNGIAWEFIISGNSYLTPLGENLVMEEDTDQVGVSYRLTPDVVLNYGWFLPASATNVDENYLINVNKILLAKLRSYEVANYPWPKQNE